MGGKPPGVGQRRRTSTRALGSRGKQIDLRALLDDFFTEVDAFNCTTFIEGSRANATAEQLAEQVRAICASYLSKLDGGES